MARSATTAAHDSHARRVDERASRCSRSTAVVLAPQMHVNRDASTVRKGQDECRRPVVLHEPEVAPSDDGRRHGVPPAASVSWAPGPTQTTRAELISGAVHHARAARAAHSSGVSAGSDSASASSRRSPLDCSRRAAASSRRSWAFCRVILLFVRQWRRVQRTERRARLNFRDEDPQPGIARTWFRECGGGPRASGVCSTQRWACWMYSSRAGSWATFKSSWPCVTVEPGRVDRQAGRAPSARRAGAPGRPSPVPTDGELDVGGGRSAPPLATSAPATRARQRQWPTNPGGSEQTCSARRRRDRGRHARAPAARSHATATECRHKLPKPRPFRPDKPHRPPGVSASTTSGSMPAPPAAHATAPIQGRARRSNRFGSSRPSGAVLVRLRGRPGRPKPAGP